MAKRLIDQFLLNVFSRGTLVHESGINYMWNNPFVFFPIKSYVILYSELKKLMGKDADELFYWLGVVQGRNSTKMLIERYGFKGKDLHIFIDGAAAIGMGYLKLTKHHPEYKWGIVEGTNSSVAAEFRKLHPDYKGAIHHYIAGIFAGGVEVIFNQPSFSRERQCIAGGFSKCVYYTELVDDEHVPEFLGKDYKKFENMGASVTRRYLGKKTFFKILLKKDFSFRSGSFYFRDIEGINLEVYLIVLMRHVISKYKGYDEVIKKVSDATIGALFGKKSYRFNKGNLLKCFERLEMLGFGKLNLKFSINNRLILESVNNPFAREYYSIFKSSKKPVDNFLAELLNSFFKNVFNKKCKVIEKECIACRNRTCLFEIKLLD
jgi:predicted hydrocarbon binding protein